MLTLNTPPSFRLGFAWPVVDVLSSVSPHLTSSSVRSFLTPSDSLRLLRGLFKDGDLSRVREMEGMYQGWGMEEERWLAGEWRGKLEWCKGAGREFRRMGHEGDWDGVLESWLVNRPLLPHVYAAAVKAVGRSRGEVRGDERWGMLRDEVEGCLEVEGERWGERNLNIVKEACRNMGEEWTLGEIGGKGGKEEKKKKSLVVMGPSCGVNR